MFRGLTKKCSIGSGVESGLVRGGSHPIHHSTCHLVEKGHINVDEEGESGLAAARFLLDTGLAITYSYTCIYQGCDRASVMYMHTVLHSVIRPLVATKCAWSQKRGGLR